MNKTTTARYTHRAFTLIELLTVIAVIAVFAALLIPVFAVARQHRDNGCLSRDQRLTEAFCLYAQDYDMNVVHDPELLMTYVGSRGVPSCLISLRDDRRFLEARDRVEHGGGTGGSRNNPNMTYHGGVIMPTANTYSIFWGPKWANSTFAGDKISGLDSWYTGFSNSNYAKISDEYTGSNGQVGASTTYSGHAIDTTTASGGGSTSAILGEVCKEISAGKVPLDTSGNGYYAVYTDLPRGNAGYCAWHSSGSCNGTRVQIAFFWSLDGDAGCDPQDGMSSVDGHSQGLAALANVTAHELSEARTDPASPGAWYDRSGQENGDKCAWTFNVPLVYFPNNGTYWKLQGEWSNNAYTTGTGYPNSSGQKGCLDGK